MRQPIFSIILPIQRCTLNINIAIRCVKVNALDGRCLARCRASNRDRGKERWRDVIHVLAWIREDAEHRQRDEGAHSAAVVVTRYAAYCRVELAGNVVVNALCRLGWATCVMVLEDGQEALFIANVDETCVM